MGLRNSTFRPPHLRRHPLKALRSYWRIRDCVRADYDYWKIEEEHKDTLMKATQALGLTFVAIDYSSFVDGSIILWEANPYPGSITNSPIPYVRRSRRRARAIFDSLSEGLVGLAP